MVAVLLATVAGAYGSALEDGFVWDDITLVEQDERIRSLDHVGQIFSQDFFEHSNEQVKYGYYRPLVTLSYLLDHALWGFEPMGYHLTNLLLHSACSLAVYAFALVVVGLGWQAAFAAAVLFAVHPVHSESVTWIAGRTDVLATLLVLVAWLVHARAERAPSARRRRAGLTVSAAVLLLALLAKELAIVLPFLLFAFALGRLAPRAALARVVPHLVAVGIYAVVRFGLVHVAATPLTDRSLPTHLATASSAFWRYVSELVWPLPLSAYLQHPWVERMDVTAWLLLGSGLVPIALLVVCWRLGWLTPFRLVLGFGVALLPHAGLLRVSGPPDMGLVMAERFLYFPSVFFCIGVGALCFTWTPARTAALLALVGVTVGSASAVARRNADWRDEGTFMRVTLRQAPEAVLLHSRLGAQQALSGEHAAAVRSFRTALDLHRRQAGSESPALVLDLAAALRLAGDPQNALALLQSIVRLGYDPPPVLYNLGETLRLLRRHEEARDALASCVQADPSFVAGHLSLSRVEAETGRFDEALAHYARAHALSAHDTGLLLWGGDLHRMRGDLDAAERTYREALAIDPSFARAEAARGAIAAERGDSVRARERFEHALTLDPELHEARVGLAVLHARAGELEAAAGELDAVLDRAPDNVEALLTQATLFWRQGRLAEARERAAQVLRREPTNTRALQLLAVLMRSAPAPASSPSEPTP